MPGIPSGDASPGGGGLGGIMNSALAGMGSAGTPSGGAAAAQARMETEAWVQKMGAPVMGSFKKGGIVPRTGAYKLHAGEKVIPVRGRSAKLAAAMARSKSKRKRG